MKKIDADGQIKLFERLLNIIKKYGILNVTVAMIIVAFFACMSILLVNQKRIIEGILEKQKTEELNDNAKKINLRVCKINPRVDALLLKLLTTSDADRAFVVEMHNGTDNPTGLPFVYGEVTYEQIANRTIRPCAEDFGKITLSRYPMCSYIYKNNYWEGSIEQLYNIDKKMAMKISDFGDQYFCVISMSGHNSEIGCLVLTYVNKRPSKDLNIRGYMIETSQKISILLDLSNNQIK